MKKEINPHLQIIYWIICKQTSTSPFYWPVIFYKDNYEELEQEYCCLTLKWLQTWFKQLAYISMCANITPVTFPGLDRAYVRRFM